MSTSSEHIYQKRNFILYTQNVHDLTNEERLQISNHEFNVLCPMRPYPPLPPLSETFIYRFKWNKQYVPIMNYLPIINRDNSFYLTVSTLVENGYTVVSIRAIILHTDSLQDGISFYDPLSTIQVRDVFNDMNAVPEIIQFGNIPLSRTGNQFTNTNIQIQGYPVILSDTSTSYMFYGCPDFNSDLHEWSTSNITDMSFMFAGCSKFNSNLSSWNMSNVNDTSSMFLGCTSFNQNLSGWSMAHTTNMNDMFRDCSLLSTNLQGWTVSILEPAGFSSHAPGVIPPIWVQPF